MHFSDLPVDHLDAPNGSPAQLHLPGVTGRQQFKRANVRFERRTVKETAEGVEDYGDAVVGEHGEGADIGEVAEGMGSESGPDV